MYRCTYAQLCSAGHRPQSGLLPKKEILMKIAKRYREILSMAIPIMSLKTTRTRCHATLTRHDIVSLHASRNTAIDNRLENGS